MAFEIVSIRHLTTDDYKLIPEHDNLMDRDDYDDEQLKSEDYVFVTLRHNDRSYYMVHGFPGDNAAGFIFNLKKEIKAEVGESCQDVNKFTNWYIGLGDDVCKLLIIPHNDDE